MPTPTEIRRTRAEARERFARARRVEAWYGRSLRQIARQIDAILRGFDLEDDTGTRFISAAVAAGYKGKILMVTAGMSPHAKNPEAARALLRFFSDPAALAMIKAKGMDPPP